MPVVDTPKRSPCDVPRDMTAWLVTDGLRLVDQGNAPAVLETLDGLGADASRPELRLVRGACLLVTGASAEAITCLEPLMDGRAAVAWRLGAVHYLLGDPDTALAVFARASRTDPDLTERARLASWSSAAHWAKGDEHGAARDAREALELARRSGHPGALAAAHLALGLHATLVGDRCANATHLELALEHAERAGDIVQQARLLANRASKMTEEGRHEEALAHATASLEAARSAGFTVIAALSASNRGLALLRVGRLNEALLAFGEARDAYQRIGSRRVADALCGLGDVHRERGNPTLARAAYEEALAVLGSSADCQARVPVLAGLARVLWHDDPARARALADDAAACTASLDHPFAVATAGWIRLLTGDVDDAIVHARRAVELAGARRNTGPLADALELSAMASEDRSRRRALLNEAAAAREHDGDVVGTARAQLAHAHAGRDSASRRQAVATTQTLTHLGVRIDGTPPAGVLAATRCASPPVAIRCLGRFEVHHGADLVPATAWQSRKARDLLKLLVARRGRPVAREQLMDSLWPDIAPAALGNRLAVVLATVRRVLDPQRAHPLDHYIVGEDGALALDVNHVDVDLVAFLDDVAEARRAAAEGRLVHARDVLVATLSTYRGDAFEEEPYADWAWSIREETRIAYAEALHVLASIHRDEGDQASALAIARQLLSFDPYNETAHQSCVELLTAAGRHGEARRAVANYASRMRELGLDER